MFTSNSLPTYFGDKLNLMISLKNVLLVTSISIMVSDKFPVNLIQFFYGTATCGIKKKLILLYKRVLGQTSRFD